MLSILKKVEKALTVILILASCGVASAGHVFNKKPKSTTIAEKSGGQPKCAC